MLAFRRQGGGGHARKPPKDEVIQFFRAALVLASRGQASYSVSSGARLGLLAALIITEIVRLGKYQYSCIPHDGRMGRVQ